MIDFARGLQQQNLRNQSFVAPAVNCFNRSGFSSANYFKISFNNLVRTYLREILELLKIWSFAYCLIARQETLNQIYPTSSQSKIAYVNIFQSFINLLFRISWVKLRPVFTKSTLLNG